MIFKMLTMTVMKESLHRYLYVQRFPFSNMQKSPLLPPPYLNTTAGLIDGSQDHDHCPHCGYANPPRGTECPNCGIVNP